MGMHARNLVIISAAIVAAIWLSSVKSIIAFLLTPIVIAIGALCTDGTRITKLIYWVASFVLLTVWLFIREASLPIEPPGLLALLGFWLVVSFIILTVVIGMGYVFNKKNSA